MDHSSVDIVPGTEIMRDVGNIHFIHGPKSGAVLIPIPSDQLDDPLNWSRPWKYLIATAQALYCFVTVASALSMAPMFPLLAEELKLNDTQLSLLTGTCVLALGYANLLIVPISNIFGRRFVGLFLGVLVIATCIWEATAKSYHSLIGARVLNGFATATSETLMVQVVADVFFLHERGLWMGFYFTAYFTGLFVGPVISGNISARHGWRSFFWLSLGLSAFTTLGLLFFSPETKYHRPEAPVVTEEIVKQLNNQEDESKPTVTGEKESTLHIENFGGVNSKIGQGKPSRRQFNILQRPDPRWKTFLLTDIISAARVAIFPIIFWTGLNVAGPANLLLFWNLKESAVLGGPPNNFSISSVGYANFAFMIGGFVGLFTAGPLSDIIAKRSTIRNNGIREPEMRLPALIPYFITTVVGIVVGGIAQQRQWHWPILLVFGYGLTGLCVTSIPSIAVAYAIDCYKPIAGEIMIVATVLKNTCGFAMSYWVPSMVARDGYLKPAMVEFALVIGPLVLGLPIWYFGKSLRRITRNSKVHRFDDAI